MADVAAIREQIAAALDTISGLRVHADGLWPDTVNPPAACIKPTTSEPATLDWSTMLERFEVVVVVRGGGPYESAQKALDPYCASTGASSVQAALMAGLGATLNSLSRREYGVFEIGGAFLAGAAWDLEVIA